MANSVTILELCSRETPSNPSRSVIMIHRTVPSTVLYEKPINNPSVRYIIILGNVRDRLWTCNLKLCPRLATRIVDGRAIDQELLWYRLYLKYLKHLSTNENAYGEESAATLIMSKCCGCLYKRALAREDIQLMLPSQFHHQDI